MVDPDIGEILHQWDHDPSRINARKIIGKDGKIKVQMRVELGLLQMEADGRPDGKTPHACESLLEYHAARLDAYQKQEASDSGFLLDSHDCTELQEEAVQYYYRYLCLFTIEDFERAERDTARNLRVFDLVWKYASQERDKRSFEQYRPYVIMMNTRANASIALRRGDFEVALRHIEEGIASIERFSSLHKETGFLGTNTELSFLKSWADDIKESRPVTHQETLEAKLRSALQEEDYEAAARLRDEIDHLKKRRPSR